MARAHALILSTLLLAAASAARAQVAASLSLDSEVRIRGLSVSDNRPAATLSVSYDAPNGLYAGASAIGQEAAGSDVRYLGHTAYVGYAARGRGADWDVGVVHQDYSVDGQRRFRLRYTEAYAGVSRGPFSGRLYYSPNYLRSGSHTLYAELNAAIRPAERWRLTGHAGVFHRLSDPPPGAPSERYDLRLGLAREFRRGELRLSWTTLRLSPRPAGPRDNSALVAGAAVYF